MRNFYEQWNDIVNRPPMAGDLQATDKQGVLPKKGAFKPSYLGQLSAYIRMLNDDERKPHENPTIGIVLCRDADKTYVEYLLQDYTQPMGVATYQIMPETLKKVLPPEEEFKRIFDGERA